MEYNLYQISLLRDSICPECLPQDTDRGHIPHRFGTIALDHRKLIDSCFRYDIAVCGNAIFVQRDYVFLFLSDFNFYRVRTFIADTDASLPRVVCRQGE